MVILYLPLDGGGRSEAAGGGDCGILRIRGDHPTPSLRADPPHQGEGEIAPGGSWSKNHHQWIASRSPTAAVLRASATDAEVRLWRHLWRIPIDGTHFRRQVPIGRYFADFACHQIGLIIELDGSQHADDHSRRYDSERTTFIESQGYQVIRFWNAEVMGELEAVLDSIFAIVQQRQILLAEADRFYPVLAQRADPQSQDEGEEQ